MGRLINSFAEQEVFFHAPPEYLRESEQDARMPFFFTLASLEQLGRLLGCRHNLFVEITPDHDCQHDFMLVQDKQPNFGIAISSQYAYYPQTSMLVTHSINERIGLSRIRKMQILTCLQEAITNAVIHGNLGVKRRCESLAEFEAFHRQVDAALHVPENRQLRVYVQAWDYGRWLQICVRHQGPGVLSVRKLSESHPSLEQKSGRGLFIIQSLAQQAWTDDAGKSLYITFAY
ncbi:MAG: ATP-binding protein [Proteobacteria bacterium]|nr:ATP-binding protein [Pseudomonadota bacterium]